MPAFDRVSAWIWREVMVHTDTYLKAIVLKEEREVWVDVVIVYQNLVHRAPQESESNTGWASRSQRLPDVICGGKAFFSFSAEA